MERSRQIGIGNKVRKRGRGREGGRLGEKEGKGGGILEEEERLKKIGRRERHTRIMAERMRDRREKEKRAKTREVGNLEKEERVSMSGGDRVGKEERVRKS